MSKSVSCRTPADHGQDETRIAGNPTSTARTEHISSDMGTVRITLRVLRPDGDVRQDIGLLIARDTEAQNAQVSRVWCPVEDTDLPLRKGPLRIIALPADVLSLQKFFFNNSFPHCPPDLTALTIASVAGVEKVHG